jgi:hypothetical protein
LLLVLVEVAVGITQTVVLAVLLLSLMVVPVKLFFKPSVEVAVVPPVLAQMTVGEAVVVVEQVESGL